MPYYKSNRHNKNNPRMAREKKTIKVMITMYCHDLHQTEGSLCKDCQGLLNYAEERLAKCPFRDDKPTCANCQVHCYRPHMRENIRQVMRYAGPRISYRHPILAIRHFWDGRRKPSALE